MKYKANFKTMPATLEEVTLKKTMTAFRKQLNDWHADKPLHKHFQFHQIKRDYGDYLYFQDREKFDVEYALWIPGQTQEEFEATV